MKQFLYIGKACVIALMIITFASCSAPKDILFADREWSISNYYDQIVDKDTTFRMTFGNVIIPEDMTIISCADSAAKYPGMERYIADILKTAGLEKEEVLFYSPTHSKMFVRLNNPLPARKPSSLTAGMSLLTRGDENERPCTMWVYDDDVEKWERRPDEMYTYTYFDRKKGRILVVDFYDYGVTPIAEIFVLQSRNKMTDRMELPTQKQLWDFSKYNLKDYERNVEYWSHRVELHRKNAFDNYVIGQEQLKRKR